MKKVLVTGGAGFIGSHLVEELVKNKNYEITIIDDLSTGKKSNLPLGRYTFANYRIQDVKWEEKFDIIYHLAAKANTREKGLKDFIDNVMATEAVVKMLKPRGRIVFSSSCAVYGNQPIVKEISPFKPISPYGYSKWMCELIIKTQCKNYTIFRFSNVFGERQDGSNEMGLVGVIDYHFKKNKTMFVFNQGENERDWIYVKDVVRAMTTIDKIDIFNVGRFESYKTMDLVNLSGVKWVYGACNNEIDTIKLDNTKIKNLDWKPTLNVLTYIKRFKIRTGTRFLEKIFGNKKIIGAEIGVHGGVHAVELNENLNIGKLYLIDIWDRFSQEGKDANYSFSYKITKNKFKDCNNVIVIQGDSIKEAETFENNCLDFVYIDANHQYEYVKKDIEAWLPKVKEGGYVMGHDYGGYWKGVKKAVDEFVKENNLELLNKYTGDWWFQK